MIRYEDKILPILMSHNLIMPEEHDEYREYLQGGIEDA